jgi:hypothetical protein
MHCIVESTAPPGGAEDAATAAPRRVEVSENSETVVERAHGERIKLILAPPASSSSPSSSSTRVRIVSTARLAEVYDVSPSAYRGTATGTPVPAPPPPLVSSASSVPTSYYALEVLVRGPTELRLAGIKGAFRLAKIDCGSDGGSAQLPPHTTQAQQMRELVALAAEQPPSASSSDQPQHVPEGLQELWAKLNATPGSAEGAAVKQLAAALARGVVLGGGGGGGGAAAAAPSSVGLAERRQGDAGDEPGAGIEAAIQRSEARIMAAIDGLARRVGALEIAVQALAPSRE